MKSLHTASARACPQPTTLRPAPPACGILGPRKESPGKSRARSFGHASITTLLLLMPAVAQALDFTYTFNGSAITITGYTGPGGAVVVPDTIVGLPVTTIGGSAFLGKTSLTNVTIPSSVTSMGSFAFSSCSNLTSVTIPNSCTSIGDHAFFLCSNLTSVAIPTGVTSIGGQAFSNCTSLTSVTIPSSVASIGTAAFISCSSLAAITVDPSNGYYSSADGVLFNKNPTALLQFPAGKTGAYSIPSGVTSIGDSAFYTCRSLTSVTIPASVTSIGSDAFSDCNKLTSVTIPNSVTSIGTSAFSYCTDLASVSFEGNAPTTVGSDVFYNANVTVYYLSGTTGWAATFAGQPTVMLLPFIYTTTAGKITITGYTGTGNAVDIPTTINGLPVTAIGNSAFSNKTSLMSVTIPNSVTSIGDYAFGFSGLTNVTIPDSVTSIGRQAFDSCGNLTSLTIPSSLTSIADSAFSYCISLTSVTIPSSVTSIGASAFGHCDRLTSVVFLGNAPTVDPSFLTGSPASLTVYYSVASTGFSTPTWFGYKAVPLAAEREISVKGPSATELVDGGTAINFGTVKPGVSVVKSFTIANLGITALTGLAIVKNGKAAADFTVSALTTNELAPDADITFTVTFNPATGGPRAAAIHIASNDADENPFDISLSGTGTTPPAPEITVRQTGGKTLTDGKSKLSFGNVSVKSERTLSFTITNSGKAKLKKLAVTLDGKNAKNLTVKGPGKATLAPGARTTFKVTLKPTAKGKLEAAIHIRSNDSNENPFDISLTGNGTATKASAATAKSALSLLPGIASRANERNRSFDTTVRIDGLKYRCLTILRNGQAGPASDSVEVSSNLVDWLSGPAHTTVLEDNAEILTVRDNTPVEPGRKRFIRARRMP